MDKKQDNLSFETLTNALSINPDDQQVIDALCTMGWMGLSDKNIILLIKYYELLISKNSKNIIAINALDWILQLTGRIQSSESLFESILNIKTKDVNSLVKIAESHIKLGHCDNAILVIKKTFLIYFLPK